MVLMHGLFASSETMDIMKKMITAAHPGTPVHNIDAYSDGVRLAPFESAKDLDLAFHGTPRIASSQCGNRWKECTRLLLQSWTNHLREPSS